MALKGDGYKLIADEFQAIATKIRLIGVTIPDSLDGFLGVFETIADLESAFPPQNTTGNPVAFVKSYDTGNPAYVIARLPQSGGLKQWLRAALFAEGEDDLHLTNEGFYQGPLQNTTFTATNITNANQPGTGTPLQLASPIVFPFNTLPANSLGVVMQGVRFEDGSNNDIYNWGFGTDDWASFTEPGEFIVTDWNFKLGGFGG